jgi:nucleotide-binding universal stress UspA family protein
MLRSIMTPLDGSPFSEQAIPMALRIAERENARIELVLVHEAVPPYLVQGAPVLDPRLDNERRTAMGEYLASIADWLKTSTAVPVVQSLLDGPAGQSLAEHIGRSEIDLVVMTTHARGGLSRAWLGSVADDLVRRATVPVLLLKPDENGSRESPSRAIQRVLVALDGSPFAEEAIERAIAVAGAANVHYSLLQVVTPPTVGPLMAEVTVVPEVDLTLARAEAERYLAQLAAGLRARGMQADSWTMVGMHPAQAIVECAEDIRADMIAIATHGRAGLQRLVMGSVANKVLRGATVPVLLHRPTGVAAPASLTSRESAPETTRRG